MPQEAGLVKLFLNMFIILTNTFIVCRLRGVLSLNDRTAPPDRSCGGKVAQEAYLEAVADRQWGQTPQGKRDSCSLSSVQRLGFQVLVSCHQGE